MTAENQNNLIKFSGQSNELALLARHQRLQSLALTFSELAVGRKLVGELAIFPFIQDGSSHYAMGQITEISCETSGMRILPCGV